MDSASTATRMRVSSMSRMCMGDLCRVCRELCSRHEGRVAAARHTTWATPQWSATARRNEIDIVARASPALACDTNTSIASWVAARASPALAATLCSLCLPADLEDKATHKRFSVAAMRVFTAEPAACQPLLSSQQNTCLGPFWDPQS